MTLSKKKKKLNVFIQSMKWLITDKYSIIIFRNFKFNSTGNIDRMVPVYVILLILKVVADN